MSFCKKHKYKLVFAVVAIVVIALCIIYYFVLKRNIEDISTRGSFGDMFGAVGALFSGLAFAGVIVTMLQQREELELQRQEISQTNKELELQRKEMESQNRTIILQRFENTFFNLLNFNITIRNGIYYTLSDEKLTGDKAAEFHFRICSNNLDDLDYIENYIRNNGQIDYYCRNITGILKFIDQSDNMQMNEKTSYVDILLSNISFDELGLFYCYCLTSSESIEVKYLAKKYAFFKSVKQDSISEDLRSC